MEVTLSEALSTENAVLLQHGNLGISMHAVPILLRYSYKEFEKKHKSETVDHITKCLVLCCPDCITAWNNRKRFLDITNCEFIDKELKLTALALQIHPKSSETLSHRRWIFMQRCRSLFSAENDYASLRNSYQPTNLFNDISQTISQCDFSERVFSHIGYFLEMSRCEFVISTKAAVRRQSNYNAWAHKTWVLDILKNASLSMVRSSSTSNEFSGAFSKIVELVRKELSAIMGLMDKTVSDISLSTSLVKFLSVYSELTYLHNNGPYIQKIQSCEIENLWADMLHRNAKLLDLYDAHESLWCLRRNLFLSFQMLFGKRYGITEGEKAVAFSLESETRFCTEKISGGSKRTLAERHLRFLKKFIK